MMNIREGLPTELTISARASSHFSRCLLPKKGFDLIPARYSPIALR